MTDTQEQQPSAAERFQHLLLEHGISVQFKQQEIRRTTDGAVIVERPELIVTYAADGASLPKDAGTAS